MARQLFQPPSGHNLLSTMVHTGLLQLVMVVMVIAERCTRAVPSVQEYPAKKVHVLRRVPAACSNWDKAWAWLTKVDCGTKYRLDYVTVPPREVKQYKLQYVCCDGDTDCKEAENVQSAGFDSTDEKFLAIVLGSAAACVVIIIIVFAITFYTKKTRCYTMCDQETHVYASADGDETQDSNRDNLKYQPEDFESETDQKGSEVEYAEINDPRLPRYTDIFKETLGEKDDPFNRASAPPMYSAVTGNSYINSDVRSFASLQTSARAGIQIVPAISPSLSEGTDDVFEEPRHPQQGVTAGQCCMDGSRAEGAYYNVKEKKRRKKRSSSSSKGGSTSSNKGDGRIERNPSASVASSRVSSRKIKTGFPVSVEMMVKSSSASETIGKTTETSLIKQKRRSAPPDTVEVPVGSIHRYPVSAHSASASSVSRSDSNSVCSVINEVVPEFHRLNDARHKIKSTKDNSKQKAVQKTSKGNKYENSSVGSPKRSCTKNKTPSYITTITDLSNVSGSIPPSNAVVLTCCDSTSLGLSTIDSEYSQPNEQDSLLRRPSCQSGCGSDQTFEDWEHCSKYDRLHHVSDPDVASLHIYQCLDDVKRECQEFRAGSSTSCSNGSPTKSDSHHSNNSIGRQEGSVDVFNDSIRPHRHAHC